MLSSQTVRKLERVTCESPAAMSLRMTVLVVLLASLYALCAGWRDITCDRQEGYCTFDKHCEDGYYREFGLCSGPRHRQCCVPYGSGGDRDRHCEARNGYCDHIENECDNGSDGYYQEDLCPGPSFRQCCLPRYR